MSREFHYGPMIIRGSPIARTPDAVSAFVHGNAALAATLSVEEKILLLRTLSTRPLKTPATCQSDAQASVLLLRDVRHNRADLGRIAKGLGGPQWIQVLMGRLVNSELRMIGQEMIDQAAPATNI